MTSPLVLIPPITVRPDPSKGPEGTTSRFEQEAPAPVGEASADTGGADRFSAIVEEMDRRAAAGDLSPRAQEAWEELKRRRGMTAPQGTPQTEGFFERPVGLLATGFNKGLAGWVDTFNEGLKAIGLPMSDEPFMGTAFVDKYLGGAGFTPQNSFEAVLQRAGLEVGGTVPLLGASLAAQPAAKAKQAAGALDLKTGTSQIDALKSVPRVLTEQLAEIGPAKLAVIETALAAGGGAGAEVMHEAFPEGGPTAEFVGELIGSFTPSVALGLVRKSIDLAHGVGRAVLGYETREETKRRVGKTLESAATPEEIQAGVEKASALREEITPGAKPKEGFQLSAGESIEGTGVQATQIAQEKLNPKLNAEIGRQRAINIEAVRNYFEATAPEGNPTRFIEELERQRHELVSTGQASIEQTQAKLDAVRGDISKRAANLLNNMEARLASAEERVQARLKALGPQFSTKDRGAVIRSEYQSEVEKFRERATTNYQELDNLGPAEIPVTNTLSKLEELNAQFPEQIQIIRKLNPRVDTVLNNLGRDYELVERAAKAQADLEAVTGKSQAHRGGFKVHTEQLGHGSTPEITGVGSTYPYWYRELTNKKLKISGEELTFDRETIEAALDTIRTGKKHGLHDLTLEEVEKAIRSDSEFKTSPFYDPIMEDLHNTLSADLRDLRQVRSDLLAMSRKARVSDARSQGYVLHELIGATDQDIDALLPNSTPFAARYPEHGAMYRDVSADYRAGIDKLMRGTANRLRRVNRYGDFTEYDESIPALFWRNETTMQDFERAFENRPMAKAALRDYAFDRFLESGAWRDQATLNEWLNQHRPQLKAFPDLEPAFRNTQKMQEEVEALRHQVEVFQRRKEGEQLLRRRLEAERRPGDYSLADLSREEARLKDAQTVFERSTIDWDAQKASLFLKTNVRDAAYKIATSQNPIADYEKALAIVKGHPDAVAGLNRAIWEGLAEKIAPRLIGVSGDTNLGVLHKELQKWVVGNTQLMSRVLGMQGMQRIETTIDAIERIASGKKTGSDTAIALRVQAALLSTWLSRGWATLTGRVPAAYGLSERGLQLFINKVSMKTAEQQADIIAESFMNPELFQTLVMYEKYGPNHALVKHRMAQHLHLLNMSEQHE